MAGLVLEQDDIWPRDLKARQDDIAVERGQGFRLDVNLVDRGQVVLGRAVDTLGGFADMQAADGGVGRKAEQVDAQMPIDAGRTVGLGRDDRAQSWLGPIPVRIGQEDDDGDEDDQESGDQGQDPAEGRRDLGDMMTGASPAIAPDRVRRLVFRFGRGVGLRRHLGLGGAAGRLGTRFEGLVVAAHDGA